MSTRRAQGAPENALSSHLDREGRVRMVDVGAKGVTARRAVARATVTMRPETLARLRAGTTPKGDVAAVVRVAGIQAAKRTPELIPLCHAVALTRVEVAVEPGARAVVIMVTAEAHDRTGVEMEALTAASVAALTLYDMLKGIDRTIAFGVELVAKAGGRSGEWGREGEPSDTGSAGGAKASGAATDGQGGPGPQAGRPGRGRVRKAGRGRPKTR